MLFASPLANWQTLYLLNHSGLNQWLDVCPPSPPLSSSFGKIKKKRGFSIRDILADDEPANDVTSHPYFPAVPLPTQGAIQGKNGYKIFRNIM